MCLGRVLTFLSVFVVLAGGADVNNVFTTGNSQPSFGFHTNLVKSIAKGAEIAIEQCQNSFKWNKWNCPESTFSRKHQQPSTKELAYARAVVAAGIVHTITRNCSRGELQGCGCNPKIGDQNPIRKMQKRDYLRMNESQQEENADWSWGGCSDNVEYGMEVARVFLDEMEHDSGIAADVSLHNNFIGREMVKTTMVKRCRCHGVSGSCSVQTCWMQVAAFSTIATKLKLKYQRAKIVPSFEAVSNNTTTSKLAPNDELIFLEESPDYCLVNSTINWAGVKGRQCSRSKLETATQDERRSCRNVCRACGLRVKKQRKVIKSRCNCRFKWCCEVKCDTCVETVQEFHCL